VLLRIHRALPDIHPNLRPVFLQQAKYRCNRLSLLIRPMETAGDGHRRAHNPQWGFFNPLFDHPPGVSCDGQTLQVLVLKSWRYAHGMQHWLNDLDERLRWFICNSEYPPPMEIPEPVILPVEKIVLKVSVPKLGAITRALYESGVFGETNKARLIEQIASVFCTPPATKYQCGQPEKPFRRSRSRNHAAIGH
jgi:hypothetical protein